MFQKSMLWLFERYKHSQKPNTIIIIIKCMAVNSGKDSEYDNEPVCFVIFTLFERLRLHKLHCIAWRP